MLPLFLINTESFAEMGQFLCSILNREPGGSTLSAWSSLMVPVEDPHDPSSWPLLVLDTTNHPAAIHTQKFNFININGV